MNIYSFFTVCVFWCLTLAGLVYVVIKYQNEQARMNVVWKVLHTDRLTHSQRVDYAIKVMLSKEYPYLPEEPIDTVQDDATDKIQEALSAVYTARTRHFPEVELAYDGNMWNAISLTELTVIETTLQQSAAVLSRLTVEAANAKEALDLCRHERKYSVEQAMSLLSIQGENGNWNYDSYMHGMYNGMALVISILDGSEDPKYREAPEKWLSENGEKK